MELTEENIKLCASRLMGFRRKQNFPVEPDIMILHARHLCKMVANLSVDEVVRLHTNGEKTKHTSLEGQNDLDWVLTHFFENSDVFPEPHVLREYYSDYMTPDDEFRRKIKQEGEERNKFSNQRIHE